MFNRIRVRREVSSRMRSVILCSVAGIAVAASGAAKDIVFNTPVDVETTVSALHEAPAGSALPGLHLDANVKGRMMDIYISPVNFAERYGVRISKGDYIHIVGTQLRTGGADVVVARAISTGSVDKRTGTFREDMTIYLRNDDGPLW